MDKRFDPITPEVIKKQAEFDKLNPEEKEVQHQKDLDEAFLLNAQTFEDKLKIETDPKQKELLELSLKIAKAAKEEGGLALVVGGYVRDEALRRFGQNLSPKDIDLEVYGMKFSKLRKILENFGTPKKVGKSFAVMKLGDLDVSVTRKETKTGRGHRSFKIIADPTMIIKQAARRRDFTVNAMALDPFTGEIIDKFGGLEDLKNKILRVVDPKTFIEDPLRVLRAMRFAGKLDFKIAPETIALCRSIDLTELSKERIGYEWLNLLLSATKPSIGLEAAKELGIIEKLHPELAALESTPQDPQWHPEGNVWIHTKMVVDAAAEIIRREKLNAETALVIMLASLCHDLGKPAATEEKDGRIISHEHSAAGIKPTKKFLIDIGIQVRRAKFLNETTLKVLRLVNYHLFPSLNRDAGKKAIQNLVARLAPATVEELVLVGEADHRGRSTPWEGYPEGAELLQKKNELAISKESIKQLVMGRDLLSLGILPGPEMGQLLKKLYQAQLDGEFQTLEEGLEYFKKNRANFSQ